MDGCLTICHRIKLHENLGEAHRKHVYQLMANELKIGHVKVSLLYMVLQLVISLGLINFMDGINGITAGYSLAVLGPLAIINMKSEFIDQNFLITIILGVLVFCFFNFRPKGKAKCFAGDVGSIGIAFILLFAIGKLIM